MNQLKLSVLCYIFISSVTLSKLTSLPKTRVIFIKLIPGVAFLLLMRLKVRSQDCTLVLKQIHLFFVLIFITLHKSTHDQESLSSHSATHSHSFPNCSSHPYQGRPHRNPQPHRHLDLQCHKYSCSPPDQKTL